MFRQISGTLTVVGTADKLDSPDDVYHEVAKSALVLALSLSVREADMTRSSLCSVRADLAAPCRPSLSDAEMAGSLGWRKTEVGKWIRWDRR
jgi:hypothetical protein